jgi:phosphocarrier protein HPr
MISIILTALNAARLANRSLVSPQEQKSPSRRPGRSLVKKAEKEITILNRRGLDAQLANLIVEAMNWFSSDIWILKNGLEVDGKSRLGLIVLGAKRGSRLRIRIEGPDAPEAMQTIEQLMSWSDEDSDTPEPEDVVDQLSSRNGAAGNLSSEVRS